MGNRAVKHLVTVTLAAMMVLPAHAQEVVVPIPLQVELLVKLAAYDRNMDARVGARFRTLILTKAGNGESQRVATQVKAALAERPTIAEHPHDEEVVPFSDGPGLVQTIKSRRAALVYVTPGFTNAEVAAMVNALNGVDVLTASAVPDHVKHGIVLGFDLSSGRTNLMVNLKQANKQNVSLGANVLRLMTVIQ